MCVCTYLSIFLSLYTRIYIHIYLTMPRSPRWKHHHFPNCVIDTALAADGQRYCIRTTMLHFTLVVLVYYYSILYISIYYILVSYYYHYYSILYVSILLFDSCISIVLDIIRATRIPSRGLSPGRSVPSQRECIHICIYIYICIHTYIYICIYTYIYI